MSSPLKEPVLAIDNFLFFFPSPSLPLPLSPPLFPCDIRDVQVIHGTDDLSVVVERGMADGQEISFARAGDQLTDIDTLPGDVIFVIRAAPHSKFVRCEIVQPKI